MAVVGFGGQSQQRWGDNTASVGETFRDLHITDLRGVPQQTLMARRKGMVVVVFFTTTDPVSAKLLPLLQSLSDAYQASGKFSVLAVSETDDDDAVKAFATANGLKIPVMIDREGYHAMNYGFTVIPTLVLINGGGFVQHKAKGAATLSTLSEVSVKIGKFAGMLEPAKLEGDAFTAPIAPPPPPPADGATAPPKA